MSELNPEEAWLSVFLHSCFEDLGTVCLLYVFIQWMTII